MRLLQSQISTLRARRTASTAALILLFLIAILSCRSASNNFANRALDSSAESSPEKVTVNSDSTPAGDEISRGLDVPSLAPGTGNENGLSGGGIVADEIIILLAAGSDEKTAENVAEDLGAELLDFIPELNAARLKTQIPDSRVPSFTLSGKTRLVSSLSPSSVPDLEEFLIKAGKHPKVRFAEPHYFGQAALTPDDAYYAQQYYIRGTKVNQVWDSETGSSAVTIAVLDAGVDYGHPEFAGKIHPGGRDFIDPPQGGDGRATPGDGLDQDNDGIADNGAFHGSRVAGVALAIGNNEEGIAGTSWGAHVLSLRIDSAIGEPTGWLVIDCVRAMVYTLKIPEVRIINISAVYPRASNLLLEATNICAEYGKIIVASAGNQGLDTPSLCAPAYFEGSIAVGGTDGLDRIWADGEVGSNFGTFIDILAPATNMVTVNSNGEIRTYISVNGTSFSAPVISGISALILSKNPSYTVQDVRAALSVGAVNFDSKHPEKAGKMGVGLVNALSAYSSAAQNDLNITGVRPQGLNFVDIFFSRRLEPEAACDVSHYSISPQKYIYAAVLMDDGQRVRLETSPFTVNNNYEITVTGITAADGAGLSPPVQQVSFTAKSIRFDLARASNGAIAYSKTEYSPAYSASKAIDGLPSTFWFAEVESGTHVDFLVTFPRVEYLNQIHIEGRSTGVTEPAYASKFELYAAAVYNDLLPSLDAEFTKLDDPMVMNDGIGTIDGKSTLVINFPAIQAKHIVIRFMSGSDGLLDSDDTANGISISRIFAYKVQGSEDIYGPVIRTMTPDSAQLGALVQITGNHFGDSAPPSRLLFGDIEAVILSWTNTEISALVPYNPLSLPVQFPSVFPPETETTDLSGGAAEIPPVINAIIPPSKDAESGYVSIGRNGFTSNKLFFAVLN